MNYCSKSPCLQNNAMSNFRRAVTMGMPCSAVHWKWIFYAHSLLPCKAYPLQHLSSSFLSLSLIDTNVKSSHCIACLGIFKGNPRGKLGFLGKENVKKRVAPNSPQSYSLLLKVDARHFRFSNLSKMAARRPFSKIQEMLNNSLNMIVRGLDCYDIN